MLKDLESFKTLTPEEQQALILEKETAKGGEEAVKETKTTAVTNAQKEVVKKYKEVKNSWLWIRNIWLPDKATVNEILTHANFQNETGIKVEEEEYNQVMGLLLKNYENTNQVNGYYILAVIVLLVSFFSQWLNKKITQPKAKNGQVVAIQQPGYAKILMWILPIVMMFFTISNSTIFSLYIIANSLMSTIITPVTTIISNKIEDKKEAKRQAEIKVDYRR